MSRSLQLTIEGARQNNLKNVSVAIPHDRVTVITGVSGSGKSSLAFDTLFAEGQWRYIESLSTYARMFLDRLDRPDVDRIEHIRPAIALEQKNPVRTARSTVGTATELHDYLRLLFAKIGRVHCPACGTEARSDSAEQVAERLVREHAGARALICFPVAAPRGDRRALLAALLQRGFARVKVGDTVVDLAAAAGDPAAAGEGAVQVVLDRVVVTADGRSRITESMETALAEGHGVACVDLLERGAIAVSRDFRCPRCDTPQERPRPLLFSFNHPLGACAECKGFGNILRYDEARVVPDQTVSLADGAVEPWSHPSGRRYQKQLMKAAKRRGVDVSRPYRELPDDERQWVYQGGDGYTGIQGFFEEVESYRYKLHVRVFLSRYRSPSPCARCGGARLKPEALAVRVGGLTIAELSAFSAEDLARFLDALALTPWEEAVARDVLRHLRAKTAFLLRVGLGYLTLARQTRTLSGGEAQRINLANQLGSQLTGTLYVLDEPSIGLHARDTARLAELCRELAQAGNTVVIVEHDRTLMEAADHLIEMGPGSGERGGQVVFSGSQAEFLADTRSLTARYLSGRDGIPLPVSRREGRRSLVVRGARAHNLKRVNARIPLHTLTCVTGVSGSGKSTLVHDTLYRALARHFKTDFETPGASRRDPRARGSPRRAPHRPGADRAHPALQPGHVREGVRRDPQAVRRPAPGQGPRPRARRLLVQRARRALRGVPGRRRAEARDVLRRGRVRDLHRVRGAALPPGRAAGRAQGEDDQRGAPADGGRGARLLRRRRPRSCGASRCCRRSGLGYLRLGQPATTLSGGEAQRLKIAAELATRLTADYLYILDEPTTGLHLDDIKKLLAVLGRLVDAGNTVLVVEHHLDVVKTADWVIDLGPEGGDAGGEIVAEGTPEQVAQVASSYTGKFLRELLPRGNGRPAPA